MKKYKKILQKIEKSGNGAVEWDYLADMKEINLNNHVVNPPADILSTHKEKVVKEEAK